MDEDTRIEEELYAAMVDNAELRRSIVQRVFNDAGDSLFFDGIECMALADIFHFVLSRGVDIVNLRLMQMNVYVASGYEVPEVKQKPF